MAIKPDIIIETEARQMISNGVNYTIQQTGISMLRLEPIVRELYNEIEQAADAEYKQIQAAYEQELKAEATAKEQETIKDEN